MIDLVDLIFTILFGIWVFCRIAFPEPKELKENAKITKTNAEYHGEILPTTTAFVQCVKCRFVDCRGGNYCSVCGRFIGGGQI